MLELTERLAGPWIKIPRTVEMIDELQTFYDPSRDALYATILLAHSKTAMTSEGLFGHILNPLQRLKAGIIPKPSSHEHKQVNIPTKIENGERVVDYDQIDIIPFIDKSLVSPRAQQLMSLALLALRFTGNHEINNRFNSSPTEPMSEQISVSEAMERFYKVSGSDQTRLDAFAGDASWRDLINNKTNPDLLLQPFRERFTQFNPSTTMYTRLGLLRAEHRVQRVSMSSYDVDNMLIKFSKGSSPFSNLT